METKQEFIDGLRRALTGKISQSEVEEHIRYYEDYITAETRKNGSEKEVLDVLGSPSLIAMSICAAGAAEERVRGAEDPYNASAGDYSEHNEYRGYEEGGKRERMPFVFRHPKLTLGLIVAGVLLVIILFLALAFSLLKFLWPAIVSIVSILLLVHLIVYLRDHT